MRIKRRRIDQRQRTDGTEKGFREEPVDFETRDAIHPWIEAALHGSESTLRTAYQAGSSRYIARGHRRPPNREH